MNRSVSGKLTAICFILLSVVAQADDFDHVREIIRQRMAEEHVPGISVAVARDGKIIWEEGFGWADAERHVPASAFTVYSVASVTKPVIATELMLLDQEGKLSLAKPVNSYLGPAKLRAFEGNANDVTLMQLASHNAGLPEHYHFFYADERPTPPLMDVTIRRYGIITSRPGERFLYSNLGYGILGYVISRVSKRDLGELLDDDVFRPLGMTTARFGPTPCPDCAVRYDERGTPIPAYDFDHRGASALWASAHDLLLFGLFHAGASLPEQHPILSQATRLRMQQIPAAKDRGYGLGWNVWRHPDGYDVVYHGGNMPGVSADLTIVPSKGIVVVVLANRSCSLPYRINDEIIYKTLLPVRPAVKPNRPASAASMPQVPMQDPKDVWVGAVHTYAGVRTLVLEIKSPQQAYVALGGRKHTLNKLSLKSGLQGEFSGDLRIRDARPDSTLVLNLDRTGDKLTGTVTAYAPPGARIEYGLSQWVELRKRGSRSDPQ